jgi:hypothetical protein
VKEDLTEQEEAILTPAMKNLLTSASQAISRHNASPFLTHNICKIKLQYCSASKHDSALPI